MTTADIHDDDKISQSNKNGLRNPWLLGLIGLLAVVVSVDTGFIITAIRTFPGLVNQNYYDNGQNYSKHILDRRAAREALDWKATVEVQDTIVLNAPQNYRYIVLDKDGKPVRGANVMLYAYRSANADADFSMPMTEVAPGQYEAHVAFKLKGHWDLIFEVANAYKGFNYDTTRHIFVMKM